MIKELRQKTAMFVTHRAGLPCGWVCVPAVSVANLDGCIFVDCLLASCFSYHISLFLFALVVFFMWRWFVGMVFGCVFIDGCFCFCLLVGLGNCGGECFCCLLSG